MGGNRIELILKDADQTRDFAAQFARSLLPNSCIALYGALGAGKTTFMQGLIRGLGGRQNWVQSPTFVYLHSYPTAIPVFHFDLYRMRSEQDFLSMGFTEYFEKGGITAIEWPERIASLLPPPAIAIHLTFVSHTARRLVMDFAGIDKTGYDEFIKP